MKLREVAEVIKGTRLLEDDRGKKIKKHKVLSMLALESISFLDKRKIIEIKSNQKVSAKQITQAGDVVVSLYSPMIACYVEKGQEGYVIPHYMAIVRVKPYVKLDSRFIVHFINSARGRRGLAKTSENLSNINPTSLPIVMLNEVELVSETDNLVERF